LPEATINGGRRGMSESHGSKAAETTVKIVIPSVIRLVDLVHSASEKMAEMAGFDAEGGLNFGLAVREAVINAIVHGNGKDPGLDVEVEFIADGKGMNAVIRDQGSGFDPEATPDPTAGPNVLKTSGRGLLLIRAFVDDVLFSRRSGRGMEVRLIKNK
jgi:serine/threonine-protein kinase RsbW